MLIDAILKLHAKIMDEPLGPKRAALRAERGERTELVASSVKYGPQESPRPSGSGKSAVVEARNQ